MKTTNDKILANFRVDKQKWELFKKIAAKQESDANKELRKLINKYIEENKNLLDTLF